MSAGWIAPLRRRKLVQWALAYIAAAWVVLQVLELLAGVYAWPPLTLRVATGAVALGLPVALTAAWYHGERGEQRVSGAELTIISALLLIGGLLLWRMERAAPEHDAGAAPAAATPETARAAVATERVPAAKSVAVLPFLALSEGRDDGFFADGLTEEILNALSQLPELLVTARTSAFHFKGKDATVTEVAHALGVAHVLEGSVRRSGEKLRITAQLIRAADGFHVWSQAYDRDQAEVFAIQDDIAHRVAAALDVLLDDARRARMHAAGVRDVEAFIAFQKGVTLFDEAHQDGVDRIGILRRANVAFDAAIARVPEFYLAHLHWTDLYSHSVLDAPTEQLATPVEGQEVATAPTLLREGLERAWRSANTPGQRDSVAVTRRFLSNDWTGLVDDYRRLYASPECTRMIFADHGIYLGLAGEALARSQRLVGCDPYSWYNHSMLVHVLALLGEFDRALGVAAAAHAQLGPGDGPAYRVDTGAFFAQLGKRDFAAARRAAESPAFDPPRRAAYLAMLLAAEGRSAEARAAVDAWRSAWPDRPLLELPLLAWIGDLDGANRIAARLDAAPLGAATVIDTIRYCLCGAPFDLAATPNLAARIAEAGHAWPPPAPLTLPLKTW